MEQVSLRVAAMAESETILMSQKSRELQAQGIDIINLSLGEPDFATPQHIKDAAKKAIDDNFSYYSPVPGFVQLRNLIVQKLEKENGINFTFEQIVVSNGAKQALLNSIQSIIDPGDEVIVPAPYWVSYLEIIKLAGGKSIIVESSLDQDFKITPQQLEASITPATRAFIINSPSNPTGSVYSGEELEALVKVLEKHPRIIVISDEIYEHIIYEGKHVSIASFPVLKERVVVINGFSKGYAMTGWRIGYLAGPKWVAKACGKLQGQQTSGACSVAQMAAVAAYSGALDVTIEMRNAFMRRRDMMLQMAHEIKGIKVAKPQGAFYLFPDVSAFFGKKDGENIIHNADQLSIYLLEKGHVATVSGSAFGSPKNLRISYAASDEKLQVAMLRIKAALENLT